MNEYRNESGNTRSLLGKVTVTRESLDFSNCPDHVKEVLEPTTPQLIDVVNAYSYLDPLPEHPLVINTVFFELTFKRRNDLSSIEIRKPYIAVHGMYTAPRLEDAKPLYFVHREDIGIIYNNYGDMLDDRELIPRITRSDIAESLNISIDAINGLFRFMKTTRSLLLVLGEVFMSSASYKSDNYRFATGESFFKLGLLTLGSINVFFQDSEDRNKTILATQMPQKPIAGFPFDTVGISVK
ncbi:MAG: hypothetical protein ACFFD4_18950 [Candidatus Odinarchaeota archaeon]